MGLPTRGPLPSWMVRYLLLVSSPIVLFLIEDFSYIGGCFFKIFIDILIRCQALKKPDPS